MNQSYRAFLFATLISVLTFTHAAAQQLSVRRYTVANGLAHDQITSLLQDSRGYLWIGTFEGVSRFDGYSFVSYSVPHGLGTYVINGLAEDAHGRLWVATNGSGLARLDDRAGAARPFSTYAPGAGAAVNVNVVVRDHSGRLWCGTDAGVYVADVSGPEPTFSHVGFSSQAAVAAAVHGDRVWMGIAGVGLVEFRHGKATAHPAPWVSPARFEQLLPDGDDGVFVASSTGFYRFRGDRWERVAIDLRPQHVVLDLLADGRGGVWLATTHGLVHYTRAETRTYSLDRGVGAAVTSILADRSGNLWVGLGRSGLARISPEQIFSYSAADGLPESDVTALVEDAGGDIHAVTRRMVVATISGERIVNSGASRSVPGNRPLAAAKDGWFSVNDGVHYIPGAIPQFDRARRLPLHFAPAHPLPSSVPFVQVDSEGQLWVASTEPALYRIARPTSPDPFVTRWPLELPAGTPAGVLGIDRAGGIWLANMTMLARFANGRVTVIDAPDGVPQLQPRTLIVDHHGNVWIGLRFGGAIMTADPAADRPTFTRYGIEDGLASDTVWALAEDRNGFIYLGTGRGLDQLDPVTRRVRHFSTEEGLAGNVINHLMVDRAGAVWAASMGGVSRLDLSFASSQRAPLPIYISRVMLAGVEQAMPERGATRVGELQLAPSERNLRIDFVSPGSLNTGRLRYQYMLQPVDSGWSAPGLDRTINYATLAPGQYQFRVRAIGDDDRTSDEPAAVDFVIHPPFWSTPWSMATIFAGLLAAAMSVQQLREHRRQGMAAIRRQVATDLHDDVGSGLSQIAILTEVAKRKAQRDAIVELGAVADLARSLRDSMSDIVWAVDPDRDVPMALVERMRQVTFNLLSSSTEVTFQAPADRELARVDLTPDRRRHLLLIFKEAITNIARHAGATIVVIELALEGAQLVLTIRDNGVGFDPAEDREGRGLDNLVTRSRSIGAEIEIRSAAGQGTTIRVLVPLRRHTRMFRWLPTRARRG
jgi:ligand-binding sensor domain-containing protein